MRMIIALLTAILLITGTAAAETENPPALTLESDGIIETPVTGSYSWTYLTGDPDEWTDLEACGTAPTDPAVSGTVDHVLMTEGRVYTIRWNGTPPDELMVFSWDTDVFNDPDHPDNYQENPEIILHTEDGKIALKPDRVYDFQAKWLKDEDHPAAYGTADYYLVTERLIMLDGPDSVMMGGWSPSVDPTVTDELKVIFDKGTSALTGSSLVPVAYLGSQVVAGTNYAFLCRVVTAYPGTVDTAPSYAIAYFYQDLQGNVSILNIADFDIGSLCTYGAEE